MRRACRKCRREIKSGIWTRFLSKHIPGGDSSWYHGPVPPSDESNAGACGPVVELEEAQFDQLVKQGKIIEEVPRDVDLQAPEQDVDPRDPGVSL